MQINLSEFEAGCLTTAINRVGSDVTGSKEWAVKPILPMLIARADEVGGAEGRNMMEMIPSAFLLLETLKGVLMKFDPPHAEVRNETIH